MNLTEEKVKETIEDLNDWLNKSISKEDLTINGIDKINNKLAELKIPRSIVTGFESVYRWYSNLFVFEFLKNNTSDFKKDAAACGYQIVVLYDAFFPKYPNNPQSPSFDNVSLFLANCISEKWFKEGEAIIEIINKGLDTSFLKGGLNFKPAAWFIIQIVNNGYKIPVDYSKYNYPKNMGVYQEAIDSWNTNDLNLVDAVITKLCDYHLENATYGDGENTADIQFGYSAQFVYAYEILTWLSIREKIGLKNPEKFNHPLMSLALNKLPKQITPRPNDELFEKVLAKITN